MAGERFLVVAPSWVGDAILSEPLIALLREPYAEPNVDVLAPPWCAPVYRRMRGIRRIIESPFGHGKLALAARRLLGRELKAEHYTRAFVLPNSWKSALVPWFAGIPRRTGYVGEARYALLNDPRKLDKKAMPMLVTRYAALAGLPGTLIPVPPAPVLVPDAANRSRGRRIRTVEALAAESFRRFGLGAPSRRLPGLDRRLAQRPDRRDRGGAGGGRERREVS